MASLLGGAIGAHSILGNGSSFSFYVATKRGEKPDDDVGLPSWFLQATRGKLSSTSGSIDTGDSQKKRKRKKSPIKQLTKSSGEDGELVDLVPKFARPAPRRMSSVSGFKILVVEDNAINQRVLRRQLEARQCEVYTADNGAEAVEFVRNSALNPNAGPDAKDIEICLMVWTDTRVLLNPADCVQDCEMPVMNGIVASQNIRQMHSSGQLTRRLPILGVSANVRREKGMLVL